MPWYAVRPRDPADPRWPLPGKAEIVLKADHPDHARDKFEQAYPSAPFGNPGMPAPETGAATFRGEPDALTVEETEEPRPSER